MLTEKQMKVPAEIVPRNSRYGGHCIFDVAMLTLCNTGQGSKSPLAALAELPVTVSRSQENAEETRHVPSDLEHEDLADARCWNAGDRPLLTGRVGSCS